MTAQVQTRLHSLERGKAFKRMATPFVPVPVPMERVLSGATNPRRPQRASSLGSASSSSESSSTKGPGDDGSSGRRGNSSGASGSDRSCFTPPCQSPITRARMNGLDPTVEYASCPRPDTPPQTPSWEERPITPTVLGYEVMEERAKFTVREHLIFPLCSKSNMCLNLFYLVNTHLAHPVISPINSNLVVGGVPYSFDCKTA